MGEGLLTLSILSCLLIRMVIIMMINGGAIVFSPHNMVIQCLCGGHMVIILA